MFPIPNSEKATKITGKLLPKMGTKSPIAVITIAIFSTFFLPIFDCQIPAGTERRKNHMKATNGINCSKYSGVFQFCFSSSTPVPTRSTILTTKNENNSGRVIFRFVLLVFIFVGFL